MIQGVWLDSEGIINLMQRMNLVELCGFGNECGKADLTVDQAFLQKSLVWEIYQLPTLLSKE